MDALDKVMNEFAHAVTGPDSEFGHNMVFARDPPSAPNSITCFETSGMMLAGTPLFRLTFSIITVDCYEWRVEILDPGRQRQAAIRRLIDKQAKSIGGVTVVWTECQAR